jgi:hypothetical protein
MLIMPSSSESISVEFAADDVTWYTRERDWRRAVRRGLFIPKRELSPGEAGWRLGDGGGDSC